MRPGLLAAAFAALIAGCCPLAAGPASTSFSEVANKPGADALAISDALEALIAEGKDTPGDRELALKIIRAKPADTAEYAFARAAVTGRVVQSRGLGGASLVSEVETWAERSRRLNPNFRAGAAARMLGTLYVMAPSGWLEHGDSEQGLELLEGLVKAHPEALENQLRLAEAYIALGDPKPATTYLCRCQARRNDLRHDDQQLLDHLFADAGHPACPTPPAAPAAPAAAPAPSAPR